MKKYYLFMLIVSSLCAQSCTNDEEIKYSCDKATDVWVKENLEKVRSLTRSEWIDLGTDKQIASYRAFTPEQKIQFWRDKIIEVKKLEWSKAEIRHIEEVEDFLETHHHLFSNKKRTDAESDELELFFYMWQKKGVEELGWTDRVGISLFGTGYPVVDTSGNVAIKGIYPPENCHCNTVEDFCNPAFGPCIKVTWCNVVGGCGWFWGLECNGRCNGV